MPIDSSKFFDSIRIKPNKLSAKQQAQAREEIWTPEKEREEKGGLWTPGSD